MLSRINPLAGDEARESGIICALHVESETHWMMDRPTRLPWTSSTQQSREAVINRGGHQRVRMSILCLYKLV